MQIDEIKASLKLLLKPKRYKHTLYTAEMAEKLAEVMNEDKSKAYLAGLIHDCAKNLSNEELLNYASQYHIQVDYVSQSAPYLLHGAVGACFAREKFGIEDEDVLSAVTYHTTGRENMTLLDKIIFMADLTERSRTYDDVDEIRKLMFIDFDKAMIMAFNGIIEFILRQNSLLHIDTVNARNYLLLEQDKKILESKSEPLES